MPTISIFFGIVVQMYWRDHPPPHFHAYYQGSEGLFSIDTGELIAGRMPPAARRILKDWTKLRRLELLADWQLCMMKAPLNAIPGADQE
jgi:Domain of unknown function (DUF4160)